MNPKQHPNLPYPVKDIFDVAKAVLQGPYIGARRPFASMTQVSDPQTSMLEAPTVNNGNLDPAIKMENFDAIISELTKSISELVSQSCNCNTYGSPNRNIACNMCGGEHYIRDCNVDD